MKDSKKEFIKLALGKFQGFNGLDFSKINNSEKKLEILKQGFSIFSELISEKRLAEYLKKRKIEANALGILIALRHYFVHFSILFNSYEECFIQKDFIRWGQNSHYKIDSYFSNYKPEKFKFENIIPEEPFFPEIKKQKGYSSGESIFLKNIINDDGLTMLFLLMRYILEKEFINFKKERIKN